MLVEFKVKNFKSIRDEIAFSMETGEKVRATQETKNNTKQVSSKMKLLKSALIFGPNASGKSNFLSALMTLNELVVSEKRIVSQKLEYSPYGNSIEPTEFFLKVIKNKTTYTYEISYNVHKIVSEKLSTPHKVVFDRSENTNPEIRDNQTLLFYYQDINQKESSELMKWFTEDLIFNSENLQSTNDTTLFEVLSDKVKKKQFLDLMQYVDFNIIDVEVMEVPQSYLVYTNMLNHSQTSIVAKTLRLKHHSEFEDFNISFELESEGTKDAIRLILTMLSYSSDKVLLIDEFDASFHLELSQTFLSLINSAHQTNQFILTTHEVALMDYNMRKDQIYFMDKDSNGSSQMYSLFDFKQSDTRNDVSISKKYLAGRFGAVPVINDSAALSILGERHG